MIIGSPGGSCIPGMVILGTLGFLEGRNAQEIVGAPRFHHQFSPDVLRVRDPTRSTPTSARQLEARGHMLQRRLAQVGQHAGRHLGLQDRARSRPRPIRAASARDSVY